VRHFISQTFSNNYKSTIGVDFALKVIRWDANTQARADRILYRAIMIKFDSCLVPSSSIKGHPGAQLPPAQVRLQLWDIAGQVRTTGVFSDDDDDYGFSAARSLYESAKGEADLDIAGQERFGSMTRVYYKDAVGALIAYDVTRKATFDAVRGWKAVAPTSYTMSLHDPL
jgi:GTPase SAR1 family protein